MMAEDWNDCTKSDIEMHEIVNKTKTSNRFVNAMMTLHIIVGVSYSIGVILTDVDVTDPTIKLPHICKMKVPFSINTQLAYKIVLLVELIHLVICSWTMSTINGLLILILHIGGQINILHYWIAELIPKKNKHKSIAITLKKIIWKHQKIINFAKNIESLYTFIALTQFVTNTVVICLTECLIITALGSPNAAEKILSVMYYSVTNIEAFIYCYAGEYLINKIMNSAGSYLSVLLAMQ